MLFILNPFDTNLDLTNKEDRKLFESGTKGLPSELKLSGDKERFKNFRKLIGDRVRNVRLMEVFEVVT